MVAMKWQNDIELNDLDREAIVAAVRPIGARSPTERVIPNGSKARGKAGIESGIGLLAPDAETIDDGRVRA